VSARKAAAHSSSSRGFRALKLMPNVPNWAALDACAACRYTSPLQVISKPTKPDAMTVA